MALAIEPEPVPVPIWAPSPATAGGMAGQTGDGAVGASAWGEGWSLEGLARMPWRIEAWAEWPVAAAAGIEVEAGADAEANSSASGAVGNGMARVVITLDA